MPTVAVYFFAEYHSPDGPILTAPQFHRLNSCYEKRLIIWDFFLSDPNSHSHLKYPLAIVPSEDLGPTEAQRLLYQRNLEVDKKRVDNLPRLNHLLRDRRRFHDYMVGPRGPEAYDCDNWGDDTWQLLMGFTQLGPVEHPRGAVRASASHHIPLWRIHERLMLEQDRPTANGLT